MQIVIRRANRNDAALLANLAVKTFYETYAAFNTEEDMKQHTSRQFNESELLKDITSSSKDYFLAIYLQTAVGYAALKKPGNAITNETAEIARIYVSAAFKKMGIGKQLIEHCMALAKQEGYKNIRLGVWKENKAAIIFYEKMGFRIIGEETFLLGGDLQFDWAMGREL
jgi:ribosomal protein S18 acetylase RimI-like enzyme